MEGHPLEVLRPVHDGHKGKDCHDDKCQGTQKGGYGAYGIFYVIILTLIFFFVGVAVVSSTTTYQRDANGKKRKPSVDKTNYLGILIFSILLAIIVVWLVSYWRK